MHVRLNNRDRLVGTKIIVDGLSEFIHLSLDRVDLVIKFLQLRAEVRIDDVVILLGFPDVNALLKHGFSFEKFF